MDTLAAWDRDVPAVGDGGAGEETSEEGFDAVGYDE
jgi:hypothetical protein